MRRLVFSPALAPLLPRKHRTIHRLGRRFRASTWSRLLPLKSKAVIHRLVGEQGVTSTCLLTSCLLLAHALQFGDGTENVLASSLVRAGDGVGKAAGRGCAGSAYLGLRG